MGRYYRRRYRRQHMSKKEKRLFLAILFFPITLLVLLIKFIVQRIERATANRNDYQETDDFDDTLFSCDFNHDFDQTPPSYTSKDSIMTDCEKQFFQAIKDIVGESYVVQPQINLASIIDKNSSMKYRNELFRNIDMGIFDRDYKLLVLVEINDATHSSRDRRERDAKVAHICNEAKIPLVVFWTKYGVNKKYIKDRLGAYLALPGTPCQSDKTKSSEDFVRF